MEENKIVVENTDAKIVIDSINGISKDINKDIGEKINKSQEAIFDKLDIIESEKFKEIKSENEVLKSNMNSLKEQFSELKLNTEVLLKEKQSDDSGFSNTDEVINKSQSVIRDAVFTFLKDGKQELQLADLAKEDSTINKSVMNTFNNARFGSAFNRKVIDAGSHTLNAGTNNFLLNKVRIIDFEYSDSIKYTINDDTNIDFSKFGEFEKLKEVDGTLMQEIQAMGVLSGAYITLSPGFVRSLVNGSPELRQKANQEIDRYVSILTSKFLKSCSQQIFSGNASSSSGILKGVQGIAQYIKENIQKGVKAIASQGYRVSKQDLLNLASMLSKETLSSPNCALYLPFTVINQFFVNDAVDGHSNFKEIFETINGINYYNANGILVPVVPVMGRTSVNQNAKDLSDFLEGFENYQSFTSEQNITHLYEDTNTNAQSGKVFALLGDLTQGYIFGKGVPYLGRDITGIKIQGGLDKGIIGMYGEQFGMVTNANTFALGYIKS
jgi:hypothetical protein